MGKMEAAEQTSSVPQLQNSPAQTVTVRQLSKERQIEWIERLFLRLSALYGSAFARQWEGTDLANVKDVWADKLGGFTAAEMGEALKACEEKEYPPNLPEFIGLCRTSARRSPTPVYQAIGVESDKKAMQEAINSVAGGKQQQKPYDYRLWAMKLKEKYLAGETLYPIQIQMASEATGVKWEGGECRRVFDGNG